MGTQAMLDATTNYNKTEKTPKGETENKQIPSKAGYGSTEDTSYIALKDEDEANKSNSKTSNIIQHDRDQYAKNAKKNDKNEYDEIKEQEPQKKEEEHHINISQTNIVIANAGFDEINGDYRWFVSMKKWCLFRENKSYSMENGVDCDLVYNQLTNLKSAETDFRWNENVKKCWIISNMDEPMTIYYAAPQTVENEEYIPNDKDLWISVHGSLPSPDIYQNLLESSLPPDKDEEFGNNGNKDKDKKRKNISNLSSLQPITESEDNDIDGNKVIDINDNEDQEENEEEDEDESLSDLD